MVGAIAATFAGALGLNEGFILENVRYELLIASVFIILFSGFLLPTANLAGTHVPAHPIDSYRRCSRRAPNGTLVC